MTNTLTHPEPDDRDKTIQCGFCEFCRFWNIDYSDQYRGHWGYCNALHRFTEQDFACRRYQPRPNPRTPETP